MLKRCGNADALYALGTLYEKGLGFEKNINKAIDYYEKACYGQPFGSMEAQMALGLKYMRGDGVPKDMEKSRKYFEMCGADMPNQDADHKKSRKSRQRAKKQQQKTSEQEPELVDEQEENNEDSAPANETVPEPQPAAKDYVEDDCPVCFEALADAEIIKFPCGHALCKRCAIQFISHFYLTYKTSPTCPMCRAVIPDDVIDSCCSRAR
jgi:hypothetical protein